MDDLVDGSELENVAVQERADRHEGKRRAAQEVVEVIKNFERLEATELGCSETTQKPHSWPNQGH